MLRASIEYSGSEAELDGIADGAKAGDAGIAHGERLLAFVDAAVAGTSAELATARDALREAAGSAALVDAAAVIGNFERMVRIADGTGIPLDGLVEAMSGDFREELRLDRFQSLRLRPKGVLTKALAARTSRGGQVGAAAGGLAQTAARTPSRSPGAAPRSWPHQARGAGRGRRGAAGAAASAAGASAPWIRTWKPAPSRSSWSFRYLRRIWSKLC